MTLHLTDCWYPGVDDAEVRELVRAMSSGVCEVVVMNYRSRSFTRQDCSVICADALKRMAGTLEETT